MAQSATTVPKKSNKIDNKKIMGRRMKHKESTAFKEERIKEIYQNSQERLYKSVIEEVISGMREKLMDDGIDEQILMDLKQAWEQKVAASKATDHTDSAHQVSHHQTPSQTQSSNAVAPQTQQQQQSAAPTQLTPGVMSLVPVQITIPAQQAGGVPKALTIHVPPNSLANGVAGVELQNILSDRSAAETFALETTQASQVIQRQLNEALQRHGIVLPPQLLQYNQVDGPVDEPLGGNSTVSSSFQLTNREKLQNTRSCSAAETSKPCLLHHQNEGVHKSSGLTGEGLDARIAVDQHTLDRILIDRLQESQVDGNFGLGDSSDEISDDDDDDEEEEDNDEDDDKKEKDDEDEDNDDGKGTESPLNSEDDVSDDPGDTDETENVVVCQYDKVMRVRTKWKLQLKDGIMNLKGKDYVFQKAVGESEW